ncbi:MAG TPA: Na/Pi cotransporter family protein, partial [Clostridiales bacterium]|nr:Na/Pi cotransporter family protein [Clostridiales bacterium]
VMVVGFVNAGIMTLNQAVGVIMGANIGTTVTSWIVSMGEWSKAFKPEFIAPLLIAIGSFTIIFTNSEKKKEIAEIIIGFGLLFIGLTFMSSVISVYSDSPIFTQAFTILGGNPFLAIFVGFLVTAIMQSSSASVGILQTLAMNGLVSWNSAIFITLGQNIGTCITTLLSSIGASKTAKRAAAIHLLFNVIGATLFSVIFYILFKLNPLAGAKSINSVQISLFHTFFNISSTILLFPFANQLVKLSGFFIDDSAEEAKDDDINITLRHLDDRILETPSFALHNAVKEVAHMGEITLANVKEAVNALLENDKDSVARVLEVEKVIDAHSKVLSEYLIKINNLSLTEEQYLTINRLYNIISNIERVGDHAENLAELALKRQDNYVRFSDEAFSELKEICEDAVMAFTYSIQFIESEDPELIRKVKRLEEEVDRLEDELRNKHIERLSQGICTSEIGVLYIDALINLERISDHSLNIAHYVNDGIK